MRMGHAYMATPIMGWFNSQNHQQIHLCSLSFSGRSWSHARTIVCLSRHSVSSGGEKHEDGSTTHWTGQVIGPSDWPQQIVQDVLGNWSVHGHKKAIKGCDNTVAN